MIHVVLCDDHAVLRRGIRDTLTESPDIRVTGEAGSYPELREVLRTAACDVLLLDLNLPGRSGLEVMASLKETHPDIKVLSHNQNAKGSREGGLEIMTALLAANPKIDGVFAINDPTAIGADLAAKQAQRSEFFIVGVDGSPDGEEALKRENSLFVATPAQDPQVMAAKAVEIGYDILQGKPAPKEPVLIPVTMIDKNNVGSYKGWTVK